jgi:hypothetical protein
MKWITPSHINVDQAACTWLISRFVDSDAEFLFVSKSQVLQVANELGAIPFDVPGVELGHHNGRCAFESILHKYGLDDPALERLARVIHCADISEDADGDPVGMGLAALSEGFRLKYPRDAENIDAQQAVFDALYTWCSVEAAKEAAFKQDDREREFAY